MRRRIHVAAAALIAAVLAACSDTSPTAPISGPSLKASINLNGCVDPTLQLALVNPEVQGLITNLFLDQNQASSTQSMWENLKKDKLDGKPLLNHIDNLTKWTLEHLAAGTLSDPDGPSGVLNATTGSVRLLDLVFRCAGQTPTSVPSVPAGFDAIFALVAASTTDQQFNTSFNDAAAFIPGNALEENTLLVLARQPEEVNVNTPFPKVSRTVDVALAGGKIKPGQNLSVLFCPLESVDHDRNVRLVVAHQKTAVGPTAPVGEGVEYLPPNQGGTLECPHGVAMAPQMEKNVLKRGVMHVAALAGKAWSFIGPKNAWAAHAAIGGLISFDLDEGSLSPMVLVDPFIETAITDVTIPTTTYGETVAFSATLRVSAVPAACSPTPTAAVCGWVGQPVTAALPGMPELTLANLKISATLEGQTQEDAIDADGKADFSFTGLQAGDDQVASLAFAHTINRPANAPDFAPSTATATYTILKTPLSVTATDAARLYGDNNPTFEATVTGIKYDDAYTLGFTTTAVPASVVSPPTYPITPSITGARIDRNYTVTLTDGALRIDPAPLNVVIDDFTRQYGDPNPANFTTQSFASQIRNGDALSIEPTTTATAASPVGSYPIVGTVTGPKVGNYAVTVTPGTLTIDPRDITVTADPASRIVGEADPTFTSGISGGLVAGDGVTIGYSTTATAASAPGSYPIVPLLSGAAASNYNATLINGTLTVVAASPSIVTLTVSVTDIAINGAGNFTALVSSPGPTSSNWVLQGYLVQGSVTEPAGGIVTMCGAGNGNLPRGNCTQSFSINPGGALVAGPATFRLELKQNGVTVDFKTVAVTLVP